METNFSRFRKGAFYAFRIRRKAKLRSAYKESDLYKVTRTVARVGIPYKNPEGEVENEGNPLPWGTWVKYPFLIQHRGKPYVRIYANAGQTRSSWFLDGKRVKLSEIQHMLLASETQARSIPKSGVLTMSVKAENLDKL